MPESTEIYNPAQLPDYLRIYYKRLFPHDQFYRWLSYNLSESGIFIQREFSFTMQDDIYIRYLSFDDQSEMEKEICNKIPYKIDIGAIFNIRPKHHRSFQGTMKPLQRELVFDIDMTDYDDVRTCCNEANICTKCWKFMSVACKVIDVALREDFGFEHILWVFSGRRGIHGWVCDKTARHLDNKARSAITDYLQVSSSSGGESVTKVSLDDIQHHSIRRARSIIEPVFNEIIIEDQNSFGTPIGIERLLKMVSDETCRKELQNLLSSVTPGDSRTVWSTFVGYFETLKLKGQLKKKMKYIAEEVQLAMLYPRLDVNVSKGINHLLKAPFCVHPKTGKVCVPFNPSLVDKFDPTNVPTVNLLFREIDTFDRKATEAPGTDGNKASRVKDVKKTSLFKATVIFEEFLRKLAQSTKHQALSAKKMEF